MARILRAGDLDSQQRTPYILDFDPAAQQAWTAYHDHKEVMMGEGKFYERFRPFAARLSDKVARIAAILHYAYDGEGQIPHWLVDSAVAIVEWYAQSYVSIFGFHSLEVEERNPLLLAEYFLKKFEEKGWLQHEKSKLSQTVPRSMRTAAEVYEALAVLQQCGCVWEFFGAHRKVFVGVKVKNLYAFLGLQAPVSSLPFVRRMCRVGIVVERNSQYFDFDSLLTRICSPVQRFLT